MFMPQGRTARRPYHRAQGVRVVESLCVEGKIEGGFDARTESLSVAYTGNIIGNSTKPSQGNWNQSTIMSQSGNMSTRIMYVCLGTNLKHDSRRGNIGIVRSLRSSFDVGAYTVVVARGEGAQVGENLESDHVVGCRKI